MADAISRLSEVRLISMCVNAVPEWPSDQRSTESVMLENVEPGFIYHEPNDVRESSDDSPVYEYQLQ
jgi:hypothetical protein